MTFFPVGLIWYGWAAEGHASWIVPQIATVFFGFGMFVAFVSRPQPSPKSEVRLLIFLHQQSIQVYITEAFIPYSASAIAAATLMRAVAGAVFPLFGKQMYERLG
jgi:DHA1 family multidrug resistance protein-like MFS transporter